MNRNVLSEILAQKREAIARVEGDHFTSRFRERALEIRKTAVPHRLLNALKSARENYRGIQTEIAVSWNHSQRCVGD
jgi:hypothetical protein